MTILTYDLRVVGERDVERALASVERRFASHATRINSTLAIGGGRVRARQTPEAAARSASRANQSILKTFDHEQRKIFEAEKRYQVASHREKLRAIERQKREEIKAARDVRLEQERNAKAVFTRGLGGVGKGVGRIGAVGKMGLATLGVGGAVLASSAVSQVLKLDEQVRRLSVSGREAGQKGMDPDALRRQFTQTGILTGIAPEQIAAGAAAYVAKTGDLDTAVKNQATYATVAQASGADVADVFSAAADLADKLDVKSVEDMTEAFAILSAQGKKGAFELKAMASEFPEVFSSAANAGVRGLSGVRDVGALMQLAKKATGSDSEASTAVNSMFRQLAAKAKDMQSGKAFDGRKVSVFEGNDPRKPMRNFAEVVTNAIAAARGNLGQLGDVFDARGVKAINPMINAYREAYNKAGGGKEGDTAGREAVNTKFSEFRNVAADFREVQRDAADVMQSASIQFEQASEQLKQAVAEELLPTIRDLAPRMRELAPAVRDVTRGVVDLASWATEHPFAGIGAVLGASVASEVAKAQLAQIIAAQMTPGFVAAGANAMKFAGAAGAASLAIYAAYDQNEDLKKATGGKGILDVGWEYLTTDKGLKEIADENLDRQAKERRAKEDAMGRAINGGSAALPPPAAASSGAGSITTGAAAPVPVVAAAASPRMEGGPELKRAAAALQDAAAALRASAPLNRSNSPSPVKG